MLMYSKTEKETENAGYELGKTLRGGDIVALNGDLGTGKTVFTRGIARALGISAPIQSPTFTIVREYRGELRLCHFDLYRVTEAEELYEIGFEDYLDDDTVAVIEWADMFPEVIPKKAVRVTIGYCPDGRRRIETER
ncbi:MAG: tRNA (adenosine(37)-N6)-threonylcarbamoyltransferase complex ATPase subunit type 1 TsaE [Clostridia bacterium]|nr:tRNA (adenosine(37)-N6)-threonylcarbamoyltransferase complex ATPase subunit type 1 TsaE [Clostridia bacterium]MBQ5957041.1 tRNA (adenosine(37)-N6)-threonylcarbamoyltransferase complex ATPase subunit type 1 TsaE [Clostridia bacterium]MBR0438897.1 tRNA (adenosine(37)-N6)-threonylcarbamoyltransferase complex ATPase subunit type 1 TsaE [Clostridia bacterium]